MKYHDQRASYCPIVGEFGGKHQQVLDNLQSTTAALIPQTQTFQFGQAVCLEDPSERVVVRVKGAEVWEGCCVQLLQTVTAHTQYLEPCHDSTGRKVPEVIVI